MRPSLLGLIVLLCTACAASLAYADPAPVKAAPTKPAAQAPAQPTAPPAAAIPAPDAATDAPPPQLYRWASDHLVSGLWYERAMDQLKAALAKDPQNEQYHLALGCAEADRAASIGYALTWKSTMATMQSIYPMETDMWEKAQKDPKNFQYGTPKPLPPPKFDIWTKDDYKKLTMTDAQANARIAELSKAAKAEWVQAIALCKTSAEQAQAEYVQGWGLQLLNRGQPGGSSPFGGEMAQIFGTSQDTDAFKSLESATKDAPDNALYWQSLGDAIYRDPEFSDMLAAFVPSSATPAAKPTDITALDAYHRALKIDSGNPMLWYRVSVLEAKSDPTQALADIKLAASSDPSNSYMAYVAAGWELKQSKFADAYNLLEIINQAAAKASQGQGNAKASAPNPSESNGDDASNTTVVVPEAGAASGDNSATPAFPSQEDMDKKGADAYQDEASREMTMEAIGMIEQGNDAPEYRTPVYAPAVPKVMAVAWNYGNQINIDPFAGLDTMQLAGGACQFAQAAGKAGDYDDATRAARAVIAMGLKMMNSMATGNGITGVGTGAGAVGMGYSALEEVYKDAGDQDMAAQVMAEEKAFDEQMRSSLMQQVQGWMQSFFGSY